MPCSPSMTEQERFLTSELTWLSSLEVLTEIRRIVLDVLKPHSPSIVELSKKIAALKGVQGVNCTIEEVDQETESLRVTIEGDPADDEKAAEGIRARGGGKK